MSGLLPPPRVGGEKGRALTASRKNKSPPPSETSNITERNFIPGEPTSSSTKLSSNDEITDIKPSVNDVGNSPVGDSVGKSFHFQKDDARCSEGGSKSSPTPQTGKKAASSQGEEEKRERRWGSARARLGSVLPTRHGIRESISRVRRKSVDPSHLMNDLNSREPESRADLKPPSAHGSGQRFLPPPNMTAATSMVDGTDIAFNAQGSSSLSRFSSRFSPWKNNPGTTKGRGQGSPQGQEGVTDSTVSEQLRSSSTPPSQKIRVRVNRFLRSGRHSSSSKSGSLNSESTAPEHLEFQTSSSSVQTPPYISSTESSTVRGSPKPGLGFRSALRRGVNSARRRMSVPFLSTPPPSDDNPAVPAIKPPERPQTVPLEKRGGVLATPGRSQFALGDKHGQAFLPSEATKFIPLPTPPLISESPQTRDWVRNGFGDISMIQPHPPLLPPGSGESPPLSPWARDSGAGEPQPWLKLTHTPPKLAEITSVAPFAVDEPAAQDIASAKAPSGGQLSDRYWAVTPGSGMDMTRETHAKYKGKERARSTASDLLKLPDEIFRPETSNGKSIEVLEEEKRRKSRDTGIMGLGPEITPSSEPFAASSSGEKYGDGEFTYAAVVREIAGLGRFPKRPPLDASTDDVSVPMPECDYDFPLPNFRFSTLSEPSSSSNEPGAGPCVASSSLTQEKSGSASGFATLTSTHAQISTATAPMTTTTTYSTTTSSTNPSTSAASPSNSTSYNCQMLLSSKRPYVFVLQELPSGTYIKVTPQDNCSLVSRSLSTLTPSYPETPVPSQTSPNDARSPASVRFANGFGWLTSGAEKNEEVAEDSEEEREENGKGKGKGKGKEKKRR